MNATIDRLELGLERSFGISRGTVASTETVIVRLEDDGAVGLGAAAPSPYYGETPDTVVAVLPELLRAVESLDDPHMLQRLHREMADVIGGNRAAKAAVDIAVHDLAARTVDLPLWRYLGLDPARSLTTSFTISLADPTRMERRAEAAVSDGFDVLKVKLGGDDDRKRIEAVRAGSHEATIRVDANGGWGPHEAIELCEVCAAYEVELVEQPVPAGDPETLRSVRERSSIPIAADESCVTARDVPRIAVAADIVVVKLMKCGGIRPAIRAIHAARAAGLEVMLGCMLETNVSIAAAAHLVPLADVADLDGSLLLAEDPYDGVPMPGGEIDLTAVQTAGTGVTHRPAE